MFRLLKWLIITAVLCMITVFAVSNSAPVVISTFPFLPYEVETQLFIVIFLTLMAGMIFGSVLSYKYGRYWRKRARTQEKRNKALENELSGIKADSKLFFQLPKQ
jgi:uncharacterized integral membrane protein